MRLALQCCSRRCPCACFIRRCCPTLQAFAARAPDTPPLVLTNDAPDGGWGARRQRACAVAAARRCCPWRRSPGGGLPCGGPAAAAAPARARAYSGRTGAAARQPKGCCSAVVAGRAASRVGCDADSRGSERGLPAVRPRGPSFAAHSLASRSPVFRAAVMRDLCQRPPLSARRPGPGWNARVRPPCWMGVDGPPQ